jgi:hypothetical protein
VKDPVLTAAFHNSAAKNIDMDCRYLHTLCCMVGRGRQDCVNKVVCFGSEFFGTAAALWLLLVLLTSTAVGIGTGYYFKDIGMGLNVGTGLLAVLLTLQRVLLLVMK